MGWNNPVVKYEEVACPGSLTADWQTCQCASGKTSRVRRGLVGAWSRDAITSLTIQDGVDPD